VGRDVGCLWCSHVPCTDRLTFFICREVSVYGFALRYSLICPSQILIMESPPSTGSISSLEVSSPGSPPLADIPSLTQPVNFIRSETLPVSDGSTTPPSNVFSTLSQFRPIASICIENVPGWKAVIGETVITEAIEIKQLLEGLSNQLFKVALKVPGGSSIPYSTVLFRVYGEHVSSFYDPAYELEVFKMLSNMGIGPKLIANGEGWRIEEFHESRVVPVSSLQNPSVFCQVASQLGRLHKIHRLSGFPESFQRTPITYERLDRWTHEAQEALHRLSPEDSVKAAKALEIIIPEVTKFRTLLETKASPEEGKGLGYDVVFCHNDAQENNMLLTNYGLRLIDFEYANFNYQMADIGNFFNEFTMDYIESVWTPTNYPSLQARRMFATVYLSEYHDEPVMDDERIDSFLQAVEIGSQLSHILWGMWSLVRAQQHADTFGSFDFVGYAKFRFDQYMEKREGLGRSE
jgi:choline kinase